MKNPNNFPLKSGSSIKGRAVNFSKIAFIRASSSFLDVSPSYSNSDTPKNEDARSGRRSFCFGIFRTRYLGVSLPNTKTGVPKIQNFPPKIGLWRWIFALGSIGRSDTSIYYQHHRHPRSSGLALISYQTLMGWGRTSPTNLEVCLVLPPKTKEGVRKITNFPLK